MFCLYSIRPTWITGRFCDTSYAKSKYKKKTKKNTEIPIKPAKLASAEHVADKENFFS